ncbi:MAG: site-specific integrase [Euryarchaeota archaeon]|nr:site-specific integrase [Euryarchaeota archaeon]MDE1881159.1 site-specific integrase [Euryarchaeota archaeon]
MELTPPQAVPEPVWEEYRVWMLGTGHGASTTRKSTRYLRWFEREFGLRLEGLRMPSAIAFVGAHREGRKPQTVNNWIRELNLWSRFRELGWHLQSLRVGPTPEVLIPTRAQALAILRVRWTDRAVDSRNAAILHLLADAGPRRAEVVHLQLQDLIPPPQGPAVKIRSGKGEKDRVCVVASKTWRLLQVYVADYRNRSDPHALFTTPRGPVSYGYLGRLVNEAGRRAGVPWLQCHKLRHFSATDNLVHGVSVAGIQHQLGHSNLVTTQRYLARKAATMSAERELRAAAKRRFA